LTLWICWQGAEKTYRDVKTEHARNCVPRGLDISYLVCSNFTRTIWIIYVELNYGSVLLVSANSLLAV
jgi:hypothetical protein